MYIFLLNATTTTTSSIRQSSRGRPTTPLMLQSGNDATNDAAGKKSSLNPPTNPPALPMSLTSFLNHDPLPSNPHQ